MEQTTKHAGGGATPPPTAYTATRYTSRVVDPSGAHYAHSCVRAGSHGSEDGPEAGRGIRPRRARRGANHRQQSAACVWRHYPAGTEYLWVPAGGLGWNAPLCHDQREDGSRRQPDHLPGLGDDGRGEHLPRVHRALVRALSFLLSGDCCRRRDLGTLGARVIDVLFLSHAARRRWLPKACTRAAPRASLARTSPSTALPPLRACLFSFNEKLCALGWAHRLVQRAVHTTIAWCYLNFQAWWCSKPKPARTLDTV